jgi:hypothetical protein
MFNLQLPPLRQFLGGLVILLTISLVAVVLEVRQLGFANSMRVDAVSIYKPQQPPLPAVGSPTQFGVYIYGNQMAYEANETIGAGNLDIIGVFEHWKATGVSSVNKIESACAGGFTPLISWESWEGKNSGIVYELHDIAEGKHDELILNYFNQLKEICGDTQIIIRFDHEMEMRPTYGSPWSPWQGKPFEYIQAWRHVVTLARNSSFENFKWLWSPNRADQYVHDYYPGGEYVDYVGMTLNHPTLTGTIYGSFEQFYAPNKEVLESFGKPIIIGEAAYYHFDEQQIAGWIDGAFEYAKRDENIVALVWFNHNMDHLNYSIEATRAGHEAFVRNMKSSKQ